MSLSLYVDQGNFRAFKILIAAEYNNVNIDVPDFVIGQDNTSAEFLAISPAGKVPALKTDNGAIFESNAIARYVARIRADTGLYGNTFVESAQVDSWVDFCAHDIELPVSVWVYPILGLLPKNEAAIAKAKADLSKALTVLNNHLQFRTFLVGDSVTLADITIASTLVYPFKFCCDEAFRANYPHVVRWFDLLVNQRQFLAVLGKVVLAKAEVDSGAALTVGKKNKKSKKQEPKKKQEKKDKPKQDKPKEDKPAPEAPKKKEEHVFKVLDKTSPSNFIMDAWKKTYSNTRDYSTVMSEFWPIFEESGWSLWRGDYKYDDEHQKLFMTSNLVTGFLQRSDEVRKWMFGTVTIRGVNEPGKMKISAMLLLRGDDIGPLVQANDDAECYTWTRMSKPITDEEKQLVSDFWINENDLLGEPLLASKVFK